ncbi:MAG: nitroreductase family protein [Deferribacteraceae bacterium]|nr:nitroreductase family protein [Deferribacteraceae bacterium]
MNKAIENIISRRTVRQFKTDLPPEAHLNAIIEAGLYAPSTKGRQSSHMIVVKGIERVKEIDALVKRATEEAKDNPEQIYTERVLSLSYTINYENAPIFIIVTVDTLNSTNTDADGAVILQNIFLAAHSLGLGSVWINQLRYLSDTPTMRAFLSKYSVPESYRIAACCAIGYGATELPKAMARKENRVAVYE